jgi:hypothetical protein
MASCTPLGEAVFPAASEAPVMLSVLLPSAPLARVPGMVRLRLPVGRGAVKVMVLSA